MPEVLDEHGNYGAVVRFTNAEWDAAQRLFAFSVEEDDA